MFVATAIAQRYFSVMRVSITDAKKNLTALLKAVENGESVTICRRGVPVVDLVRSQNPTRKKPKFGTLRGKIKIHDPNWWKPMSEEEVEELFGND